MSFILTIDGELSLRLVEPRHAEELFLVIDRNRAYLDAWMPWASKTKTADDVRTWATGAREKFGKGVDLPFSILEHGQAVGGIGLHGLDSPDGSAEMGYWLDADRQGHGIMTRAGRFLLGYGFHEHGLHRIYLWADADNARSRGVAERLGMRQEGTLKQNLKTHHGTYRDSVLYAALASEWNDSPPQH